jgi:hypothetical protein
MEFTTACLKLWGSKISSLVSLACCCADGKRSQGGVKLPTGGNCAEGQLVHASARERSSRFGGVSRFGVIPKPTVIVRMEESGKREIDGAFLAPWQNVSRHVLILVSNGEDSS